LRERERERERELRREGPLSIVHTRQDDIA